MEISVLNSSGVKLKGKHASFAINSDNLKDFNGVLFFTSETSRSPIDDGVVMVDRPGELEIGGVKIKAVRFEYKNVFSIRIDGVTILTSSLSTLEKQHGKLQEHDLVLVLVDKLVDPSFISSLGTRGVLYFGDMTDDFSKSYLKGESEKMSKFVTSLDKLPQEMITVTLQ